MQSLIPLIVQVSLVLLVASVGLQAQWRDLMSVVSKPALLARGVFVVNVVVPAVAFVMVTLLPMAPIIKIGIFMMAISPMAPFLPAKMLKSGADTSFVVGLYAAIMLLAVVLVPATVALAGVLSGHAISASASGIAQLVGESVLLPLGGGLAIAGLAPAFAKRAARLASLVAILLLVPVVVLILVKTGSGMIALIGDGTLLAIVVTVAAGLAAGHLLGGAEPGNRTALALAAVTRHPSIAILILKQNLEDRRATLAVILFLLVSFIVSGIYQYWAMKRTREAVASGGKEAAS